jgi:release factor glutamine methyltransferase
MASTEQQGMPLAYIVGKTNFMGRTFSCTPDTFLPTEETKLLIDATLAYILKRESEQNKLILIDIGTGCGNLSITLALNSKHTKILATDINPATVEVAKKNVHAFNLQGRISLFSGDLFSPIKGLEYEGNIDVVMCNPPYIPTGSLHKLPPEVRDYEPRIAFDGGPYGIDFYRRLISESLLVLKPGGILLFEIGERQEKLINRLLTKNNGYTDIECYMADGKVRAMSATKKASLPVGRRV